jgi:hypothetical protein
MGVPIASSSTLPHAHRAVLRVLGGSAIRSFWAYPLDARLVALSTRPVPSHPRTSAKRSKGKFREHPFRATRWLVRTLTGTYGLLAASRDAYRASNLSKRTPKVLSSVSKARNVSSHSFVFWELRPHVVPSLPITPHTHPPPLQIVFGLAAHNVV